jgi:hypothetical protein
VTVVAVEAMVAIESLVAGEPAVRSTDGVSTTESVSPAGVSAAPETATTAVAAASAARVRGHAAGENQHSDQCSQPS